MESKLKPIQDLIRTGRHAAARKRVLEMLGESRKLDRAAKLKLAYLARQAYIPEKAIELLLPLVRPTGLSSRGRAKASPEELAEYGLALAEVGLGTPAIKVLSQLDANKLPRIFNGLILAYFRRWEWEKALPIIERWIGRKGNTEVDRLWASYYLGRAQLHGQHDHKRAIKTLEQLLPEAKDQDYVILRNETLLALADAHFIARDWAAAIAALDQLERLLAGSSDEAMTLAARQLYAQTKLFSTSGLAQKRALSQLRQTRRRFGDLRRWERVRSCDYHEALALKDRELLLRLYFGTPYTEAKARFRASLAELTGVTCPPATYDWVIGDGGKARFVIDLSTGTTSIASVSLKPGQTPLKVLQAIAFDFFVPARIPDLHERLYPDEYFNPVSSPARVRQALWQARQWLTANGVPLRIRESHGTYLLEPRQACVLRVSGEQSETIDLKIAGYLSRAHERIKGRAFTAAQLSEVLGLSERSTRRLLSESVASGLIKRSGRGPATSYRLVVRSSGEA